MAKKRNRGDISKANAHRNNKKGEAPKNNKKPKREAAIEHSPDTKLTTLLQWFADHGITWDKERIEFTYDLSNGFRVISKKALNEEQVICTIPKSSILSNKTSSLSQLLEEEEIGGGLGLTLCLMHEMAMGESSKWYGYLQSVPQFENLPIFWSSDELKHLKGTDLQPESIAQELEDMEDDFKSIIFPIIKKNKKLFDRNRMTFELYKSATSLVASRAFSVDDYHELAMVPLSDLFNHRSGAENVHMVCQGTVCPECGSEVRCEHAEPESDTEEAQEQAKEGNQAGPPLIEMIISEPVGEQCEIFNIYDDLGNAKLLHKYGFAHENNPFDTVSIQVEDVQSVLSKQKGYKKRWDFWIQNRSKFVQKSRDDENDEDEQSDDDEELELNYFVGPDGSISEDLIAMVTVVCSSDSQFDNWKKNIQELNECLQTSVKSDPKVRECLHAILQERLRKYGTSSEFDEQRMSALSSPNNLSELRQKWALILRISEKRLLQKAIEAIN